ncbi:MAG: N-acetylmuramoyl-L-alanine amidase [Gemmatimonadetes bacterium]|nr:N-acetylmuramoyl-L-alanine amidase [Gemmatimonadota bacterium]
MALPRHRRHLLPLLLLAGCGHLPAPAGPAPGGLPPVPEVHGPLDLRVVYPGPNDLVEARDSTFLFGSLGDGRATLTVDGAPVRVWPNGAWLAWVAVPPDSAPAFHLTARTATDSARLEVPIHRPVRYQPPAAAVWLDSTSVSPASRAWWPAEEYLPVSVRAAAGSEVRLVLPDGTRVPLVPDHAPGEVAWGIRAFDRDTTRLAQPPQADRYVGMLRGRALGTSPGAVLGGTGAGCCLAEGPVIIEAIRGADTARAQWPLHLALLDTLPLVAELDDDTAGRGGSDSLTVGRARPGATYHWFFPTGTRGVVTGRLGDDLRLRLSRGQEAWVPAADVVALPPGTPAVRATVLSLTVTPLPDRVVLRIPLTARVPFRLEEERGRLTLRLYNTVSDINWTRYGPDDRWLREVRWVQAGSDEVTITLELAGALWGYRTRWSRNDLLLEVRRPPAVDRRHPLRGRRIVVDPGHPPAGATGPTGLREAEANLAVSLALARLLEADGAEVILTRRTDTVLDLATRLRLADSVAAEVLVSIHNNALPDGVNPFTNNGSSVFYNHPRSLPLARALQAALVRHLGLRDLGAARGDLALTRPTWMPAVLTEGLFMMLPEQEAALRSPAGQRAYARAVRDGLVAYLQRVAAEPGADVP